jgi:hypothetical protein
VKQRIAWTGWAKRWRSQKGIMEAIARPSKTRFYVRLFLIWMILVALGLWVEYWIRGEIGMGAEILKMAEGEWGRGILFAGGILYIVLLSLPFVPGVELGLLLMCIFGKEGIVFVYLCTVGGLNLAFLMGRWLPKNRIASWIEKTGFSPSCDDHSDEIDEMLGHSTFGQKFRHHWLGSYILKYRYVTLAVLFNLPGNYILGGGGGISLVCGTSRHISWKRFLLTVVLATSPVPLLAFFGFLQLEAFLRPYGVNL